MEDDQRRQLAVLSHRHLCCCRRLKIGSFSTFSFSQENYFVCLCHQVCNFGCWRFLVCSCSLAILTWDRKHPACSVFMIWDQGGCDLNGRRIIILLTQIFRQIIAFKLGQTTLIVGKREEDLHMSWRQHTLRVCKIISTLGVMTPLVLPEVQ